MKVHQIPVGGMQNFSYIVEDEETDSAIIIDPSWDLDELEAVIRRHNLAVRYIVNTHHHFDHTLGNHAMAVSTGAPVVQHKASELEHDISVSDGDVIEFGSSSLKVVHTPGHSKDSICLIGDGKIFSGDTLFVGSCGRVDLPGGDAGQMYESLSEILHGMDDALILYPGHDYGRSATSTLGAEKRTNMVMQKRTREQFLQMMG